MVGLKRSLLHLLLLALAIEVFAIVSPLFMQWVVDHALLSADYTLLVTLVVGFTLLLFIRVSVSAMRVEIGPGVVKSAQDSSHI
jgi:ATP-binding cassette subfamily B protein RaxB